MDAGRGRHLLQKAQARVEVPVHGEEACATGHGLGELGRGDTVRGDHHEGGKPGQRRVGGHRGGGVAGGGARQGPGAAQSCVRYRHGHPPVLEGTGRVHSLDLAAEIGDPGPIGETFSEHERSVPLRIAEDRLVWHRGEDQLLEPPHSRRLAVASGAAPRVEKPAEQGPGKAGRAMPHLVETTTRPTSDAGGEDHVLLAAGVADHPGRRTGRLEAHAGPAPRSSAEAIRPSEVMPIRA